MTRNNLTQIKYEGFSSHKLINLCTSYDIELLNIERLDAKTLCFDLTESNLSKFKKLDLSNYNISISKIGGIKYFQKLVVSRIGLLVGLIISLIFFILTQNRLFNISISGLETINKNDIISAINSFGIKNYKVMNFNNSELEDYLLNEFDLSLVSVKTKGNTLIIKVKEQIPDIIDEYVEITSNYNMILTKIDIFAGVTDKKIGDIVYIGDILVEPYEIVNGEKISVVPKAEIAGDVYFSEKYEFYDTEKTMSRTGKSKLINSEFYLGKYKIVNKSYECEFENYEVENKEILVTNYLLPINIKKTIAYELTETAIERDFENEKDQIISNLKNKCYSMVPSNLKIDNEEIKISSTKFGNIVTIYLKSSVYLNYTNE